MRNTAIVTVIPRVDNVDYVDGYSDYTFSVYVNDNLIDNNLNVWSSNVKVGNKVRVVTNPLNGRTTNYDETITLEDDSNIYLYPSWIVNSYKSEFYFQNNYITYTLNKYGNRVETPNITAGDLGYNNNWYVIKSYTPLDSWIQQDRTMRFNINVDERECTTSFGSATRENAIAQLNIINGLGINFCYLTDWNSVECTNKYQNTMNLYNTIWNYLPYSGNGFSIYKQISCDSGWSTYERR